MKEFGKKIKQAQRQFEERRKQSMAQSQESMLAEKREEEQEKRDLEGLALKISPFLEEVNNNLCGGEGEIKIWEGYQSHVFHRVSLEGSILALRWNIRGEHFQAIIIKLDADRESVSFPDLPKKESREIKVNKRNWQTKVENGILFLIENGLTEFHPPKSPEMDKSR